MSAAITAAVIGGAVAYHGASKASDAQDRATAQAQAASDAQLAFQVEQYEDWKDTYGDIEDNLSDFYKNYDAEAITAAGLQNIEHEYAAAKKSLAQELSIRGLDTSGAMARSLGQLEVARANSSAQVRAEAPLKAVQAQQGFLALGMGQESSLQAGVSNAYNGQRGLYTQQASVYGQQAASAGSALGQSVSAIGSGIASYIQQNELANPLS